MHLDVIKISRIISRMEELYNRILTSTFDGEMDKEAVHEYKETKKELLLYLFDKPIQTTDSKYFADVRKRLQRLTLNGDPFIPDRSFDDESLNKTLKIFKDLLDPEFSFDELSKIASDHFYSWFCGEDYVENKLRSQILFLQTERLPEHFKAFVTEIQDCYNFQQYIAATVLCRTILEIAVKDLFQSNNLSGGKRLTLFQRMEKLSYLPKFALYKPDMDDVRELGNSIIHGEETANRETSTEMIKKTFFLIHHLYEVN